jgi:hypothetical protein
VDTISIFLDRGDGRRRRERQRAVGVVFFFAVLVVVFARDRRVATTIVVPNRATAQRAPVTIDSLSSNKPITPATDTPPASITTSSAVASPPVATTTPEVGPTVNRRQANPSPVPRPAQHDLAPLITPVQPASVSTDTPRTATTEPPLPIPFVRVTVNPPMLHFTAPGPQSATVSNPNNGPVRVKSVEIRGRNTFGVEIRGRNTFGYHLDARQCTGVTLQPGQQCRVIVLATPAAIAAREAIRIEVDSEPVTARDDR